MRPLLLSTVTLVGAAAVSSQLVLPLFRGPPSHHQVPLMDPAGPGPALPPSSGAPNPPSDAVGGEVVLSDVMGRDRSINLFAGFVRDIESASQRLDDSSKNTTVLAPLNSVIEKLPRKPWEDPRDYTAFGAQAYEGEDGPARAHRNLKRFVEAHMIPESPWVEGKNAEAIGDGGTIWWEEKGGVRMIQPGDIEVVSVASTVANGQVWIIKQARNYA